MSLCSGICHVQIDIKISLFLVSDLDTTPNLIVSGCFDRLLRIWTLPDCNLIRTIPAKHAINCVSVCNDLVAACSRTGKVAGSPNVLIWRISTGDLVRSLDVPSCCFVKVSIIYNNIHSAIAVSFFYPRALANAGLGFTFFSRICENRHGKFHHEFNFIEMIYDICNLHH